MPSSYGSTWPDPVSLQVQLFQLVFMSALRVTLRAWSRLGGGLGAGAHVGESRWQELLPSGETALPESGKKCHYLEETKAEKGEFSLRQHFRLRKQKVQLYRALAQEGSLLP